VLFLSRNYGSVRSVATPVAFDQEKEFVVVKSKLQMELGPEDFNRIALQHGRGVLAVDHKAKLLEMSSFARESLAAGRWPMKIVTHGQDQQFVLQDQTKQAKLLDLLARIASGEQTNGGVMLPRAAEGLPLLISVTHPRDDVFFISVRDPAWTGVNDVPVLRQVFGFTRKEAEICIHIACGSTLKNFVQTRHVTENTAKSHLKQVFKKTGVRSQMQLVAVIWAVLR